MRGPVRLRSGSVLKSGLSGREKSERIYGKWRAVVLNTYVSDQDENVSKHRVECDVIRVANNTVFTRVPVMQYNHGVQDAGPLWIPRPTTQNLETLLPLNLTLITQSGRFNEVVTKLSNMDGDHVLIEFIEGDPDFPCIVGAFTHRATKRKITDGSGWSTLDDKRGEPQSKEHYVAHKGTEFRINENGDLLINTDGASPTDVFTETPNPALGGEMRIKIKAGQKLVVESGVEELVTVTFGPPPEIKLGGLATDFVALASKVLAELQKIKTAFDTHTHPAPGGATSPPANPIPPITPVAAIKVKAE